MKNVKPKEAEIITDGNQAEMVLTAISGVVDEIRCGFYLQFQEVSDPEAFFRVQAELKALNAVEKRLQQRVAKRDNIVSGMKRKVFEPLKPLERE
jgi:hypothetical protein